MNLTNLFSFVPDRRLLVSFFILVFAVVLPSHGEVKGYLKIDDIEGEAKSADHKDEIDIHGISWSVQAGEDAGSGRIRTPAEFSAISVLKFYDASSPYLFLAAAQGKSFPELTFTMTQQDQDGEFSYLEITLENCVITSYAANGEDGLNEVITEEVSFAYEQITIKYIVQAEDHSAGDEHEVEYDVSGGV